MQPFLPAQKDTLTFESNASGAKVFIDGYEVCTTPCTTEVKRSLDDVDVQYKLDNYDTKVFQLDREFNTISILNLGFLVGWGIDALTGSMFKYDKKQYSYDLDRMTGNLGTLDKIEVNTKSKEISFFVVENLIFMTC